MVSTRQAIDLLPPERRDERAAAGFIPKAARHTACPKSSLQKFNAVNIRSGFSCIPGAEGINA
jgi:hypothetical protein